MSYKKIVFSLLVMSVISALFGSYNSLDVDCSESTLLPYKILNEESPISVIQVESIDFMRSLKRFPKVVQRQQLDAISLTPAVVKNSRNPDAFHAMQYDTYISLKQRNINHKVAMPIAVYSRTPKKNTSICELISQFFGAK